MVSHVAEGGCMSGSCFDVSWRGSGTRRAVPFFSAKNEGAFRGPSAEGGADSAGEAAIDQSATAFTWPRVFLVGFGLFAVYRVWQIMEKRSMLKTDLAEPLIGDVAMASRDVLTLQMRGGIPTCRRRPVRTAVTVEL